MAVPVSWLLFGYCRETATCNAQLVASGSEGLSLAAEWFLSVQMYVLPVAAAFGLLALIAKPNPAGSRRYKKRMLASDVPTRIWIDQDPLAHVRELSASSGGGAFLGWRTRPDGARTWVSAPGEAAVLVLAPPRAGKTRSVASTANSRYGPPATPPPKPRSAPSNTDSTRGWPQNRH